MASSGKVLVPIILIVSVLSTIGVIYGALEMSDSQRSAFDVLKDLISGELTLKDIWDALTGKGGGDSCAGPDVNGVYALDSARYCVKKGCKPGYFEQGGICLKQQDLSSNVYGGTIPVDCEISGYTYSMCEPKVNRSCGTNSGTKQKYPTIIKGAIANGSCEEITEVDCDIECPNECTIDKNQAYTEVEGARVRASYEGTIVVLGKDTGYCGTGTITREYNPQAISDQFLVNEGYDTLQDYLNEVNPNGICPETEPFSVDVPCELGDNGELMRDASCSYSTRVYEAIKSKDNSGTPACFDRDEAEEYIAGTRTLDSITELPIITPGDVTNEDGNYDFNQVEESKRKGVIIKYLSSLGISTEKLQENKCTLMMTEECDAPLEDVDCVIGLVEPAADVTCIFNGCGQQQYKTLTEEVKTKPFGDGARCELRDNPAYNVDDGCTTSLRCCEDRDYVASEVCKSDGKKTYTLSTASCDNSTTQLASTKEVDCCYTGSWEDVDGYDGCELKNSAWKRKQTRTVVNPNICSDEASERFGYDNTCNYNCLIESLDMTSGTRSSPYPSFRGSDGALITHSYRKIDNISMRQGKGTGATCPDTIDSGLEKFYSTDKLQAYLKTATYGNVETTDTLPWFKCGSTVSAGYGASYSEQGFNCGNGVNPPIKIHNDHR